jgi:hypothetical protein
VSTTLSRRVSRAVANPYEPSSLGARRRRGRWDELLRRFPELARMRVLDLGGDLRAWRLAPVRPRELVLLNRFEQTGDDGDGAVEALVGDACSPPPELRRERFDLVYSNSVLEHVGGHDRRLAFAASVHELGDAHWIQTPYRYFPIEPHWLCPGLQFLPVRARAEVTLRWPLGGYSEVREPDEAVRWVLATELVSVTEMRHYFPASEIWHERFLGMTKSLVAVAGGDR